jgi:excisionase family DNA binding protein
MPSRQPLSDRQINVLGWIAGGCPAREWPDDSHKLTARALESRGLTRVRRKGKLWHAILTEDGQYYLDHGRYPESAQQEPAPAPGLTEPGQATGQAAIMTARLAVRQAITSQERRSLSAARARIVRQAAHPSLLKDIPMRYKIVVSRVQTAERHVRAISEEEAIRKVQEELERPYGFFGGWKTTGTDMDIVSIDTVLDDRVPAQVSAEGSFLLSVRAASRHLGLSATMLYELINRGEIAYVTVRSRRYISRDQINAFIEANTHTGYQPKR